MPNAAESLWKEIRGNATWDAIKWLWATGGTAVTLAVQWIVGIVRGHQDLAATLITGSAMCFFGVVALVIHRNPRTNQLPNQNSPLSESLPEVSLRDLRSIQ